MAGYYQKNINFPGSCQTKKVIKLRVAVAVQSISKMAGALHATPVPSFRLNRDILWYVPI